MTMAGRVLLAGGRVATGTARIRDHHQRHRPVDTQQPEHGCLPLILIKESPYEIMGISPEDVCPQLALPG
jgi:hypothetical protein